jgi:hypothetical protein
MLYNGSVAIYRKIFLKSFSPLNRKDAFTEFEAWIWMLATAFFCNAETEIFGINILVPRGSFVTTMSKLSETWKWSRKKVDRFLTDLEDEGAITREKSTQSSTQLRTQKCTIVKINNYNDFQPEIYNESTQSGTQSSTQSGTLNKKNIIKRNNKNIFYKGKKNFLKIFSNSIEEDFKL